MFQESFKDLNIVYSPEFIALGTVLHDMLNPDVCIIGAQDAAVAKKVQTIYQKLYDSVPEYFLLGFTEAEIAKISINSFITMKVTFANIVGSLVYKTSNGNMAAVASTLRAIGADSRINNKYFKFGTGYGGPCFPRDNRCLSVHLESNGVNSSLQLTTDNLNNWMLEFFKDSIDLSKYKNIVYVGISYKKGSNFLEESFVLKLHDLTKCSDKTYYFIDEKVDKFDMMTKLEDPDLLPSNDTLYLINYASQTTLNKLKDKNMYNFWAKGGE
jgi:UDPglucose 6-dehydrogenase